MSFIYALIDPHTHLVRYVGQCTNLKSRFSQHLCQARLGKHPLHLWIRDLAPSVPTLILLETVERRRIHLRNVQGGRRFVHLSSVMEAKWLKRFRRTVLNVNRKQCAAWDAFINSPEIKLRLGLEE